ncbi:MULTISPECIES: sensor histidine kinase [unclassified Acetobacterium]|jgi:two-component system sensor histidine kinase VanS|uniref:sensor histidine kinase n=1 Tax=unclassified Acetobacterium TaxID=2638182 RepID=UPI000DBECE05|nr:MULTISPECIES: HAMP domain-containing sensor histidine kinase [unclassified Acetobacterium]AWW27445.1 sensor histidine kinase [Acetobacterium sp. KB-1]MDZ5726115.1 HAMP domain-containing sensor histidine kinase [Acetobacterium sp. K1/6]
MKNHSIEKTLCLKLYITLTLYTLTGYALTLVADYVFSQQLSNAFFLWFYLRIDVIYFLYLVIGFLAIFHHYWKKPWGYLQETIDATKTVYQQDDRTIELSEPLKDIETQMNQIKMSILLNQQTIKEAENKKNELVMYLAHDIRTPLTSVIGYLSLLDEAPDMPLEQKQKYLGIALKRAERLKKLINEFFEITRYNTQQIKISKEHTDLYYLLIQLIDEFYPALSAKGNSAILCANENLSVYADPEKLARVFNNLLKNAVAYSYPNTEILISAMEEKENIVVTFKNNGKTIPSDKLSTVFELFNRLDDARKSDTGGAGLGLSIAAEIVHLHGGEITGQSEDDTTTLTVSLPLLS